MKNLQVSQTFYSFQGEMRPGNLAVWLRLFGCNLRCKGFSQPNPADPSTYIPVKISNPSTISLKDFPVVEYGCDTLYAIDPRFKHLRRTMSSKDVANELKSYLSNNEWRHPITKNKIDLCITGGEPLLQQEGLQDLLNIIFSDEYSPDIQFETNGTKDLNNNFFSFLLKFSHKISFNVSLKLNNVSGENYEWWPSVLHRYILASDNNTNLKIVMNSSDAAWKELEYKISKLNMPFLPQIYIMPVGSSYDQQTNTKEIEKIVRRAIDSGYHISGRNHVTYLGNAIDV